MSFRTIGLCTITMSAMLAGSALAQYTSPPSSSGTNPQPPATDSQPGSDCAVMRQQVMNTLTSKGASPNAVAAQQAISLGDKACATGDTQTAQTYYQKALILLNGG